MINIWHAQWQKNLANQHERGIRMKGAPSEFGLQDAEIISMVEAYSCMRNNWADFRRRQFKHNTSNYPGFFWLTDMKRCYPWRKMMIWWDGVVFLCLFGGVWPSFRIFWECLDETQISDLSQLALDWETMLAFSGAQNGCCSDGKRQSLEIPKTEFLCPIGSDSYT